MLILENGLIINFGKKNIFKFFLLFGVYDKPARASLLNIKNSNGFYGCMKCLQRGKSIKINKSNNFA